MKWVQKVMVVTGLDRWPRVRRIVVAVIGGTVLLFGIAMVFLPGPSVIVIPIGLVILATEFAWARWILRRGKEAIHEVRRGKWRRAWSAITRS